MSAFRGNLVKNKKDSTKELLEKIREKRTGVLNMKKGFTIDQTLDRINIKSFSVMTQDEYFDLWVSSPIARQILGDLS